MKNKVGQRIRSIRASKGYSQANVAEDLGMTPGAYAKIERGETDANVSRLQEIAKILEVRITDFFEDAAEAVIEQKGGYGFATRDEMLNLTRIVNSLAQKMEKLTEELLTVKTAATGRNKKRK